MINTIFGIQMDENTLDRHVEVFEDENELTQCPEYRLREDYHHDGKTANGDAAPLPAGVYPAGTLVHRSVHIQLKKNVMAEPVAAQF